MFLSIITCLIIFLIFSNFIDLLNYPIININQIRSGEIKTNFTGHNGRVYTVAHINGTKEILSS